MVLLLIIHIGSMVLFYHDTHYPHRGAYSESGVNSGTFCINYAGPGTWSGWNLGAALE